MNNNIYSQDGADVFELQVGYEGRFGVLCLFFDWVSDG